jgi:hypothetical protein
MKEPETEYTTYESKAATQISKAIGNPQILTLFDKLRVELKSKTAEKVTLEKQKYTSVLSQVHTKVLSTKYELKSSMKQNTFRNMVYYQAEQESTITYEKIWTTSENLSPCGITLNFSQPLSLSFYPAIPPQHTQACQSLSYMYQPRYFLISLPLYMPLANYSEHTNLPLQNS